jgi:hypothetical protein
MKKLMLVTLGLVVSGSAFATGVGVNNRADCREVLQRVAAIKAQQSAPAAAPATPGTPAPVAPAR